MLYGNAGLAKYLMDYKCKQINIALLNLEY